MYCLSYLNPFALGIQRRNLRPVLIFNSIKLNNKLYIDLFRFSSKIFSVFNLIFIN